MKARVLLLLVLAGCGPVPPSPNGPPPPSGSTPTPRIAGATMLSTGTSDLSLALYLHMAVDAGGNPLVVWEPSNAELWSSRFAGGSFSAGTMIAKAMTEGFDLALDGDGNATIVATKQLWRAPAGGDWAALPAPNGGIVVAGPHGALVNVWPQIVKNADSSQTATILASQYDPASGWSTSSALAKFSSVPYGGVEATPLGAAYLDDGTILTTWMQVIIPDGGGTDMVQTSYAQRPPGGSWSAAQAVTYPNVWHGPDSVGVFPDGNGSAIWLTNVQIVMPNMPTTQQVQSMTFSAGAWSSMQTFPVEIGTDLAFDVGAGGTAAIALVGSKPLSVASATGTAAWQAAASNAADARFGAVGSPQIAVDGQGNVTVAWVHVAQFTNPHLFYARWSPAGGWTTPAMVDGDDNPGSPGAFAVATNAAGVTFIAWEKSTSLWVAALH